MRVFTRFIVALYLTGVLLLSSWVPWRVGPMGDKNYFAFVGYGPIWTGPPPASAPAGTLVHMGFGSVDVGRLLLEFFGWSTVSGLLLVIALRPRKQQSSEIPEKPWSDEIRSSAKPLVDGPEEVVELSVLEPEHDSGAEEAESEEPRLKLDDPAPPGFLPHPELPMFEEDAVNHVRSDWEERFAKGITTKDVYRFAYGNLGLSSVEVQKHATIAVQNLVAGVGEPVWCVFAKLYFIGCFDMARIFQRQINLDAEQVERNRVM